MVLFDSEKEHQLTMNGRVGGNAKNAMNRIFKTSKIRVLLLELNAQQPGNIVCHEGSVDEPGSHISSVLLFCEKELDSHQGATRLTRQ